MTLLPTWLEGTPPGPPGPNGSSPCGFYDPNLQGLVAFPTHLFNLLSGEVRPWESPSEPQGPPVLIAQLHGVLSLCRVF